jgi:hypothetical protein
MRSRRGEVSPHLAFLQRPKDGDSRLPFTSSLAFDLWVKFVATDCPPDVTPRQGKLSMPSAWTAFSLDQQITAGIADHHLNGASRHSS